uniref:Immunoglobulin domain-containing protein oig-1 n=1 Tax=Cacopsylla melanoneura TaxID=428564 RepID=A0A8D8WQB7_9HEMI
MVTMELTLTSLLLASILVNLSGLSLAGSRPMNCKYSGCKLKPLIAVRNRLEEYESTQYYGNDNGAKIIMSSHFDYEYTLGQKIVFICVATGKPRPHITWFKDGVEMYIHRYLTLHQWNYGTDRIKSKIDIDPATQMDAGVYECRADNMYRVDSKMFKTEFSMAFY